MINMLKELVEIPSVQSEPEEELSDHCTRIQNIEAEYMEKTMREVVTENRKTAAQMQNFVEQAGKNQELFILNCPETLSKSTKTVYKLIKEKR